MDERERNQKRRVKSNKRPGQSSGNRKTRAGYPDAASQRRRTSNNVNRTRRSRARRRKQILIIRVTISILFVVALGIGIILYQKYGSSKETADLKNYYGITDKDDLAVVVDNKVIKSDDGSPVGRLIDGEAYVEYSVVRSYINERFYWDPNENIMLYTLPNGNVSVQVGSKDYTEVTEKKSETYTILKTEGRTAYIAVPFIQQYTNMDYNIYKTPNRITVTSNWGEIESATLKKTTEVRYQGGVKSPILTEVKKSEKVTVLGDESGWKKVATKDGFIGYVKTRSLNKIQKETTKRDFDEPEYTNISVGHTINMAWHNVENEDANNYVLETIASIKGVNTIAPTWFKVADTDGNLTSLASTEYVNYAHQSNLDVWATVRDFHGGINSYDETYEVLSHTSKRENLINQIIAGALQTGIDGINLDFELISTECGEHYIQFVRELSVKCRQNGLVFSVDNYVPQSYNEHFDLKEQGIVADYVVIMAYDEHTEGSYQAGSVSSYNYVKEGIKNAAKSVSSDKIIAAIPFYTRLWLETPKTDAELAAEEGTEAANHKNKVSSTALGMDEAQQAIQNAGAQTEWDDTTKQNYAQWQTEEGTYKIWLEDEKSLEEKLKLIKSDKLAGVAEWKLGWENSDVWDLILQYVN